MKLKHDDKIKSKAFLFDKLKEENAFWSYDVSDVSLDHLNDDQLIALTLRYLDLDEINVLFEIYSSSRIKKAWKKILVPEGDYLRSLNRFIAWYYFDSKKPDAYLKNLESRHLKRLIG